MADGFWWLASFIVAAGVFVSWVFWTAVLPTMRISWRLQAQGVRGPPFVPFVGCIPEIGRLEKTTAEPFIDQPRHFLQEYGPNHFFYLGPACNLYLHDASLVREITVTHAQAFCKPPLYSTLFGPLLGSASLIVASADAHPRIRRISGAAFKFPVIQSFAPVISAIAASWAADLVPATTSNSVWTEVEMAARVSALALDIISRTALSCKAGGSGQGILALRDSASISRVGQMFTRAVSFQVDCLLSGTLFIPGWTSLPLEANVRNAADKAGMQRLCHEFLDGARAAAAVRGDTSLSIPATGPGLSPGTSLLDILVSATDSDGIEASQPDNRSSTSSKQASAPLKLSDSELVDQVLTFLLAGHETSSKAITFALYLLAKHPEWQSRLREEVNTVCGPALGASPPTFEQLSDMPLLHCVVYETLRLFPPAPFFDRYAMQDVSVQATAAPGASSSRQEHEVYARRALVIPKGCVVTFPVVLIHRDPRYWDNPEDFRPLRFKDGIAGACRHPMAYLPFAHGPRNCIGSQFALLEIRAVLAVLLLQYEWELSPNYRHKPVYKITVDPKYGMPVHLRRLPQSDVGCNSSVPK